jgi:hypothetical protein
MGRRCCRVSPWTSSVWEGSESDWLLGDIYFGWMYIFTELKLASDCRRTRINQFVAACFEWGCSMNELRRVLMTRVAFEIEFWRWWKKLISGWQVRVWSPSIHPYPLIWLNANNQSLRSQHIIAIGTQLPPIVLSSWILFLEIKDNRGRLANTLALPMTFEDLAKNTKPGENVSITNSRSMLDDSGTHRHSDRICSHSLIPNETWASIWDNSTW